MRISCKGHLAPFLYVFSYLENQFYAFSNSIVLVYVLRSVLRMPQHRCHSLNQCSCQSSDINPYYIRKLHKLVRFYLSTLGICNAYFNIGHVVGMFYDWPDCFHSRGLRANRIVSGKLGMKLAIICPHQ